MNSSAQLALTPTATAGDTDPKRRYDVWPAPDHKLDHVIRGAFASKLSDLGQTIAVSREYEHFVLFISVEEGGLSQYSWALPQPTGIAFDQAAQELVVCSTGVPNVLLWAGARRQNAWSDARVCDVGNSQLCLKRSVYLPETAYIHDLVFLKEDLMATVTGHNFVGAITGDGECEPLWWPAILDPLGEDGFSENFLQLNSMACGQDFDGSFFTAFSTQIAPKSWKLEGGPVGRGVIFSGLTREVLVGGLTCPHSARLGHNRLWVCNSGFGSFGYIEDHDTHDPARTKYVEVGRVPGFARGMALVDDVILIGLSKVLPDRSGYAPGVDPATSKCGVWMFSAATGQELGSIEWPHGDQVYDIQVVGASPGARVTAP